MDERLRRLAERYRAGNGDRRPVKERVAALYRTYVAKREGALIDAAAAAAAVHSLFAADPASAVAVDPRLEEAFRLAFPNVDPESLRGLDPDALAPYLPALKGKYFEVLVRDRLNEGQWVGDIRLAPGQRAVLADSATQPGWDLQILNEDGSVAELLQLKATNSLSYVKAALERYPDIQVLTTDEVLVAGGDLQGVLGSGFSDAELEQAVDRGIEALFGDASDSVLGEVLPALPFVLIALREGRCVLMGRKTLAVACQDGLTGAARSGVAIGAGALAANLVSPGFGMATAALVRMGIHRHDRLSRASGLIQVRLEQLKRLRARPAAP